MSDDFDEFYNAYISVFNRHRQKNPIFMACGSCLERCFEILSVIKTEVSNLPHSPHTFQRIEWQQL